MSKPIDVVKSMETCMEDKCAHCIGTPPVRKNRYICHHLKMCDVWLWDAWWDGVNSYCTKDDWKICPLNTQK